MPELLNQRSTGLNTVNHISGKVSFMNNKIINKEVVDEESEYFR